VQFSVVIPAHNEAELLPRCLVAIEVANRQARAEIETIVVANRCTDRTPQIARAAGAIVVESRARNIASVRNAGAAVATGDYLVTIDADCLMSPSTFYAIKGLLDSGDVIGGGTRVIPERTSAGIRATYALVSMMTAVTGLSGGMYWCRRHDFEAIGGFDERHLIAEDLEFARRLRAYGRQSGRRFKTLRSAPIVASTRKFDRFGDWHMFAMAKQLPRIRAAYLGTDRSWFDWYFGDFND
jgi:glycosyltransferase involved in cell wall biosynthesis